MNYIGLSSGFHDAAVTVVDDGGNIKFASHNERYSKIKHDKHINSAIIKDALSYVHGDYEVHYYEKPSLKFMRQVRSGERPSIRSLSPRFAISNGAMELLGDKKIKTHSHHLSHAAAGFQTSPFGEATVVIVDAIGEFDTISIWDARYDKYGKAVYKKLWTQTYPDSLGLFYSAMTKRVGLKPLDEEYILMGMAAYGRPIYFADMMEKFVDSNTDLTFKENLHLGVDDSFLEGADHMDIASSSQVLIEHLLHKVMTKARIVGKSMNLVYGGGVALNCLANRFLGGYFNDIWIMPNPGDAGSSLGAAALAYGHQLNWTDAFLGHNIAGDYPVDKAMAALLSDRIVGVASGRAEWGPRALGNRSLLADPRGNDIKDKVNAIKRRQQFRPFAPVILEEHVNDYFDMPANWHNSRYMQVISPCRSGDLFPAIVHHDGTSRVQTVPKDGSGIRKLLEAWYAKTGCPMLLNTSLNIRGEPVVNDRSDADRFETRYNIKVVS